MAGHDSDRIGGADLPVEIAGLVGLAEVGVHGWDVAVATGRDYDVEPEIPSDATAFDRALGCNGRDPSWRAR